MCGFVAIAGEAAAAPGRVEAGLRAVKHRGPDGQGVWRAADGRAALGHARLAIIDLSEGGAQPMRSADGAGVVAYNGEIYNFHELEPRVKVRLRSRSDTEVLVELLRARGAEALDVLRGMFAFAYWDGQELLLARDFVGIKPLFWAESEGQLLAASEIAAVLAMRAKPAAIDLPAVSDYLTYLYVPPPRTGIAGVNELPPGHLLRWRAGAEPRVERWWRPPSAAPARRPSADDLRATLEDSVRAHLVSDTPVGVFLSGGLDSSSIVALAAPHHRESLRTFSVTFGDEGRRLDERGFARSVAERYATQHTEIRVKADVASILPELVARFGQPFGNPTAVLTHALSRATREHVKVALAGDGGDEILGGYPRYQGLRLARLVQRAPVQARERMATMVAGLLPGSSATGQTGDRLHRFFAASELPLEAMYYRWVSRLDGARKAKLLAAPLPEARDWDFLDGIRRRHAERSMVDAAALVDLESFLPHNVLRYGDRMSMAHALEVRVPFCDRRVVERFGALALADKMPLGIQKGLLRWAMRRDLPARVLTHRKVGFNPPIAEWLRGELAELVHEYLGERSVRSSGLLSWQGVEELRRRFEGGALEMAHDVWSLVVLEAWRRWLGSGAARSPESGPDLGRGWAS
jgi:asparagine synthase (glutamine-hydrolysing)